MVVCNKSSYSLSDISRTLRALYVLSVRLLDGVDALAETSNQTSSHKRPRKNAQILDSVDSLLEILML